jgi:hypothetical protein
MTAKKNDATETAGVDLAQFDDAVKRQNDGIEIEIKSMDGKTPLGFSIKVAGPDSDVATKAQEELADQLIEDGDISRLKAREAADQGIKYLARITLGWAPAIVLDGQKLEYSPANAEKLYRRFKFIREQVDRAAGKRAAFLKK